MQTSSAPVFPTYKGRSIGIVALTVAQFIIGIIHVLFGIWLLSAPSDFSMQSPLIYSGYTLAFGLLTLICAIGLWHSKNWGWYGTVAVSAFVIVADALTLLNLPSIPGIPKFAGAAEIAYSLLLLLYLSQRHVKAKYKSG